MDGLLAFTAAGESQSGVTRLCARSADAALQWAPSSRTAVLTCRLRTSVVHSTGEPDIEVDCEGRSAQGAKRAQIH